MELTETMIAALRTEASEQSGADRRLFMARIVEALGLGGQRFAERELGWNRITVRKGQRELRSGIRCIDNFSGRASGRLEKRLPNLLEDIRSIAEVHSSTDSTFRTMQQYTRLTANEVRQRLIDEKGYSDDILPTSRTISTKLNELGFHLRAVTKSRPKKRSRKLTTSLSVSTK